MLADVVGPRVASAQQPICANPAGDDSFYVSCRAGQSQKVAAFLHDFAMNQYLSTEKFELPSDKLLDLLALGDLLFPTPNDRVEFVAKRPSVEFRPLDEVSGEFVSRATVASQAIRSTDAHTGVKIEADIPALLQGVFWRSPGHLQLQFYKDHEIRFKVTSAKLPVYDEVIRCVTVTAGELRVTTADPEHRGLLNQFERCE